MPFGEKLIANVLFEHGVEYRYERNFRWSGVNYRPDFTICNSQGGGLIIEYFGLSGDPDYDEMSDKKRAFWATQAKKWTFLEYSPADITRQGEARFVARLVDDVRRHGIPARRLPEEEIWHRVRERAVDSFTRAMRQFVTRCRKLMLSEEDLQNRMAAHPCCGEVEEQFIQIGQSVYAGYIRQLVASNKEDFDGLLWRAVDAVRSGQTRFVRDRGREQGDLRRLRFVMVDEFQDFSEMFAELLLSIRKQNAGVAFFCVGDDWQAINGFAGSDLRFFQHFPQYFRDTSRVHIRTNHRSAKAIVEAGNALMRGLGEPAKPREKAESGTVTIGSLDEFKPTAQEEERHQGDEITPAVLRLVSDYLKRGMDVVLLSRRNGLTWYVNYAGKKSGLDGLQRFQEHIRSFLPEDDRRRVTASTTHKYKGLEQPAVILPDALDRSYPLIHPHWVFNRLFGDGIDRIVAEERRLFYVALTRAGNSLTILTEAKRRSEFLDAIEGDPTFGDIFGWGGMSGSSVERVEWQRLAPPASLHGALLEIQVHQAFDVKQQLKDLEYSWNSKEKYWYRTVPSEGFRFEEVLSQAWAKNAKIRIRVYSEARELLHSHPAATRSVPRAVPRPPPPDDVIPF